MVLLLTLLSKLAAWAFFGVLIAGLYAILEPLKRVRRSLEQIAMGVRAIEQQTAPLGHHVEAVAVSLTAAANGVEAAAQGLAAVDRDLDAAAPALRTPR